MPVFLVFLCVLACILLITGPGMQAEILQERAEGCIQVDLQKITPSRLRPYQINYLFIVPSLSNFWSKAKKNYLFSAHARGVL